jgi:DNA-binding beta-propeller fold protein YncE
VSVAAAILPNSGYVPRPHFERDLGAQLIRLPEGRRIGSSLAAAYGPDGHLWLLQEPNSTAPELLPHVVEFDAEGTFVGAWGGPDSLPDVDGFSQWPEGVEGLEVDDDGNLWVFGYKADDHAVLKFSRSGKLLLRIGERGVPGDNASRTHLNRPTTAYHDVQTREVFISDGYGNHRVIVFDADTGEFKQMWGAYGEDPATQSPERRFGNPVHKVACGPDGLIYVADRMKNRVQCFERILGGARFVREVEVGPGTQLFGAAFDIAFSPDDAFMYVADGSNNRVWIVSMDTFTVLGWTGSYCDAEGSLNQPAFTQLIHRFVVDKHGNIVLVRPATGLQLLRLQGTW